MLCKIMSVICAVVVCCALPAVVQGAINLELRPATMQIAKPLDEVRLGLYAVSDSEGNQLMAAADVIIGWNPTLLLLMGNDNTGAVPLLFSGFPANDTSHINEVIPPQDGNGLYVAWANFGQPVAATPSGTLLTTFQFRALALTPATVVAILPSAGSPVGCTTVYGTAPGSVVTGTLGAATVVIQNCGDGDIDGDGNIEMDDAILLIAVLVGSDTDPVHIAAADLNCDQWANGLDIQPFVDLLLTP